MSIVKKISDIFKPNRVKQFTPLVSKINSLEPTMQSLTPEEVKAKTLSFKERLEKGESTDALLPEAFALVREVSKRVLNQRHFDVQLIGGMVLHQGKIAEMRTGEGKTLTSTLPAYLNALAGKGVHLVTVNDYLAKRDMVWMGQVYDALGLSVGCITNEGGFLYDANYKNETLDHERDVVGGFKVVENFLRPVSRKEAYDADITYGTNHEFGFDYLRDNMVYDKSQQVQRGFWYAVVDEVDSILIDEARVPLIISGEAEDATEKYRQFTRVVSGLTRETDYTIDEKLKTVSFTEEGQNKVVKALGRDPWFDNDIVATHQLESALRAKTLFLKDRDYVVKNNEIVIIDEFTGRMMTGRRWSAGLHQAVEAKEGVAVQPESTTLATITFQNYFRLYEKISGMTGTGLTSAEEFDKVYGLDVVVIPTNNPILRRDLPDKIFRTETGKFKAVVAQIKAVHQTGQPILVGTRSVERNEYVSQLLQREGIRHEVLNAKNHEREGEIIAQAGKRGAVTIATNMAGRGVDIILGGNPKDPEESKTVLNAGGLFVLGTERHEARRIDNQLRGRSGRQGDPGASQFFVSLEDDLMRIFGGDRVKNLMSALKVPEDEPIESRMISGALESAQSKIEGFNFDARHHLLEYDDVMNKHREIIYKKRSEFLHNPLEQITKFEEKKEALENKKKELGEEAFVQVVKFVGLKTIDTLWQEHLSHMEHMRDSVKLRAYGGRDPLIEYKNEGRRMFSQLLAEMDATFVDNVLRAGLVKEKAPEVLPNNNEQTMGRNDECFCGSGKKYKKCHGK